MVESAIAKLILRWTPDREAVCDPAVLAILISVGLIDQCPRT